jgi:flagella basal body P-ring formation protein FlgA
VTRGHWAAVCLAVAISLGVLAPARAADDVLPVTKLTVYPGDTIAEDMLGDRAYGYPVVGRYPVFESREALIGKVAKRTLLANQAIPLNAVREPFAVVQGKTALLVFQDGGLIITSSATALQSGVVGDIVSARNVDSGLIIKGAVQPDGTIRVGIQ